MKFGCPAALTPFLPGSLMLICAAALYFWCSDRARTAEQEEAELLRQRQALAGRLARQRDELPRLQEALAHFRQWQASGLLDDGQRDATAPLIEALAGRFGLDDVRVEAGPSGPIGQHAQSDLQWFGDGLQLHFRPLHETIFLDTLNRLIKAGPAIVRLDACMLSRDESGDLKARCDLRSISLRPQTKHSP